MAVERIVNAVLEAEFSLKNINIILQAFVNLNFNLQNFFSLDFDLIKTKKSNIDELINEIQLNKELNLYLYRDKTICKVSFEEVPGFGKSLILFKLWNYHKRSQKQYNVMIDYGYENNIKFVLSLISDFKIKKIYYEEDDLMIKEEEHKENFSDHPIIEFKTEFGDVGEMTDKDIELLQNNLQSLEMKIVSADTETVLEGDELKKYLSTPVDTFYVAFFLISSSHSVAITICLLDDSFTIKSLKPYKLKQYANKVDIDSSFYIKIALDLTEGFGIKEDFIIDGF